MKNQLRFKIEVASLMLLTLIHQPSTSLAQGMAFTYQGWLNHGASSAGGIYDLRFTIYDLNTGGNVAGGPLTNSATAVSNGLFTVMLDFGAGAFPGADRWLEIAIRTNSAGAFANLSPRQQITATPYAITASNLSGTLSAAQLSGTLAAAQFGGTYSNAVTLNSPGNSFTGNGSGITNVNAATLGGLGSTGFWRTNGNAGANPTNGAFLGTTDNQPLEFKVNGQRALRIEYATDSVQGLSPNIVGGSPGNIVSNGFVGAAIGGGGHSFAPHRVGHHFATVVGGYGNTASGFASTAMGYSTTASHLYSTAMGYSTVASDTASTAMGYLSTAGGVASTAMGYLSTASGLGATAMGVGAKALHNGSFVWADSQGGNFASTGDNQFCLRAIGGMQLSGNTPVFFGSSLSQKLNLYSTTFGIGIQSGVQYSRVGAGGGFAWFSGGVHNDGAYQPDGGIQLMILQSGGNLSIAGTLTQGSDRNAKENFAPVQPREVLEKVLALPLSSWNYKADTATRHLGPMAQDFHAAFNVGPDDKHIATVDADGVALAAIQGLNEKLEVRGQKSEDRIQKLEAENTELKQRLQKLEQLAARARAGR